MAQVAERSGGLIAQSYFFKIENGLVKNVSIEKLRAIARGLGISEEELLRVARGKPKSVDEDLESSEFALLYSKHTRLTAQQKRDFKKVIEMVDRELDRELERGEKEGKK
ncbi:MAG: helix-turn-helix transcriptional regulator [Pyrinomonadaceae bacterium MAG19_C2-C3]|nr:helix-turn-helix transcriptional regulator [Pyrinomonadaceae bacterium MAG19_C2-C3]